MATYVYWDPTNQKWLDSNPGWSGAPSIGATDGVVHVRWLYRIVYDLDAGKYQLNWALQGKSGTTGSGYTWSWMFYDDGAAGRNGLRLRANSSSGALMDSHVPPSATSWASSASKYASLKTTTSWANFNNSTNGSAAGKASGLLDISDGVYTVYFQSYSTISYSSGTANHRNVSVSAVITFEPYGQLHIARAANDIVGADPYVHNGSEFSRAVPYYHNGSGWTTAI